MTNKYKQVNLTDEKTTRMLILMRFTHFTVLTTFVTSCFMKGQNMIYFALGLQRSWSKCYVCISAFGLCSITRLCPIVWNYANQPLPRIISDVDLSPTLR